MLDVDRQLPEIDIASRLDRLGSIVAEHPGIDALLLTTPSNIRWSTGFGGYSPWLVINPERVALAVDGRYRDRLVADLESARVDDRIEVIGSTTRAGSATDLRDLARGLGRIGVCPTAMSYAEWTALAVDLDLVAVSGIVEDQRRAKDPAEIARIERAAMIADQALAIVRPMMISSAGPMTEVDIRTELEYQMRLLGADDASYPTIVAGGPSHAARPHHRPERRPIGVGDLVVIDVGALVDGYHSDMTRTFIVGEFDDHQHEIHEVVVAAQAAGLAAAGPGIPASAVDAACRAVITEAGYIDEYLHITGHGVGLDIHENPFLGPGVDLDLRAGDVVTVEPGLYRDGFGGVRIEDLVLIGESGSRCLTASPKDDPCLPSPPTI